MRAAQELRARETAELIARQQREAAELEKAIAEAERAEQEERERQERELVEREKKRVAEKARKEAEAKRAAEKTGEGSKKKKEVAVVIERSGSAEGSTTKKRAGEWAVDATRGTCQECERHKTACEWPTTGRGTSCAACVARHGTCVPVGAPPPAKKSRSGKGKKPGEVPEDEPVTPMEVLEEAVEIRDEMRRLRVDFRKLAGEVREGMAVVREIAKSAKAIEEEFTGGVEAVMELREVLTSMTPEAVASQRWAEEQARAGASHEEDEVMAVVAEESGAGAEGGGVGAE